jgi:hypothetical protein
MLIRMYLEAKDFAREVDKLKVFSDHFVESDVEILHYTTLLFPRVRLSYSEYIARRIYFETRGKSESPMGQIEPDGEKWDTACELHSAIFKYENYIAYGKSAHPLSRRDGRYSDFLVYGDRIPFASNEDSKIDVSSDKYPKLRDNSHVKRYYSSWQVLLAAEVEQSGFHFRLNWHHEIVNAEVLQDAFEKIKLPNVPTTKSIAFAHALQEFKKHEAVLDAATTFREIADIEFYLLHKSKGGRFVVSTEEQEAHRNIKTNAVKKCVEDFAVNVDILIDAIRYFLMRWRHWNSLRRPAVCEAYKSYLNTLVEFAVLFLEVDYQQVKSRIESDGAHRISILNEVWPDWLADNKEKTLLTLRAGLKDFPTLIDCDLEPFADFITENGLETFFWRMSSFEEHALHGNAFQISGMHAEIQGMAIVVEHFARAIIESTKKGAKVRKIDGLLDQFKCIFMSNQPVVNLLKNSPAVVFVRSAKGTDADWVKLKEHLSQLRKQGIESAMFADLVAARYVRGAVHYTFPDADHFEMEEIFVSLMRAAFFCFNEASA